VVRQGLSFFDILYWHIFSLFTERFIGKKWTGDLPPAPIWDLWWPNKSLFYTCCTSSSHSRLSWVEWFCIVDSALPLLLSPCPAKQCRKLSDDFHFYTWVERGTVRVKCLAQEHNTMSPAWARIRTARSADERNNHEATGPPRHATALSGQCCLPQETVVFASPPHHSVLSFWDHLDILCSSCRRG